MKITALSFGLMAMAPGALAAAIGTPTQPRDVEERGEYQRGPFWGHGPFKHRPTALPTRPSVHTPHPVKHSPLPHGHGIHIGIHLRDVEERNDHKAPKPTAPPHHHAKSNDTAHHPDKAHKHKTKTHKSKAPKATKPPKVHKPKKHNETHAKHARDLEGFADLTDAIEAQIEARTLEHGKKHNATHHGKHPEPAHPKKHDDHKHEKHPKKHNNTHAKHPRSLEGFADLSEEVEARVEERDVDFSEWLVARTLEHPELFKPKKHNGTHHNKGHKHADLKPKPVVVDKPTHYNVTVKALPKTDPKFAEINQREAEAEADAEIYVIDAEGKVVKGKGSMGWRKLHAANRNSTTTNRPRSLIDNVEGLEEVQADKLNHIKVLPTITKGSFMNGTLPKIHYRNSDAVPAKDKRQLEHYGSPILPDANITVPVEVLKIDQVFRGSQ